MWLTTRIGFFSINKTLQTPGRYIQVRSRSRRDLEALSDAMERRGWAHLQIIETPNADYRFRANVYIGAFNEWLTTEIHAINYPNFKDTIARRDPLRAELYGRVWGVLLDIDRQPADHRERQLPFDPPSVDDVFDPVAQAIEEAMAEVEAEAAADRRIINGDVAAAVKAVQRTVRSRKPAKRRRKPKQSIMDEEVKKARRRKPKQS